MRVQLIVKNLRLPLEAPLEESYTAAAKKCRLDGGEILSAALHKRSIDARQRGGAPTFVYSVTLVCEVTPAKAKKLAALENVELIDRAPLETACGTEPLNARPLVVGFGPAGMFAALLLAERGYRPLVIERGSDIASRVRAVDAFLATGQLDPDTNIQFGAGGAGTFSDGKLVTRISDARCQYVLERFAEFGAPEEILWLAKPHVGTDRLLSVVEGIAGRIASLGGEIRFDTKLSDLTLRNGAVEAAEITCRGARETIRTDAVILAVGHSARDTYDMLASRGFTLLPKPFSVGVRAEHLQSDIDAALYGKYADLCDKNGKRILPPGEYAVSWREAQAGFASDNARGVYSFCMCPGGEVMASASEEGGIVTNGMSYSDRAGENANAAVLVTLNPGDFPYPGPLGGMLWQREIEQAAFTAGGSNYYAPAQRVEDFLAGRASTGPGKVRPTYRPGVKWCDLHDVLPRKLTGALEQGIRSLEARLCGFSDGDAVLTAPETRSSSPVRIVRDGKGVSSLDGLYPAGEGAGYAGGIMSAAVDGMMAAQLLVQRLMEERDE